MDNKDNKKQKDQTSENLKLGQAAGILTTAAGLGGTIINEKKIHAIQKGGDKGKIWVEAVSRSRGIKGGKDAVLKALKGRDRKSYGAMTAAGLGITGLSSYAHYKHKKNKKKEENDSEG